jgi:hypothetical protein
MAANNGKPLERTISEEEALNGYLLVEKSWLRKLPEPGKPFQLKLGKSDLRVTIEGVPCTCRGPDKPHEHYHLNLPLVTLVQGTKATLRPINEGRVVLDITEAV